MLVLVGWMWSGAAPAWAGPGDHIRPNDTITITPAIEVGAEYRTNVYRSEAESTPAANARISPSLDVGAEGPDHALELAGQWDVRTFLFVGDLPVEIPGTPSTAERRANLNRFNDFTVAGAANLFKQSKVGFLLSDKVGLRNNNVDAEYAESPFTTQFRNALSGGVRFSPTSGVSITPSFLWAYDDYRIAGLDERYNARNSFGPQLEGKWGFFPRTALVVDANYIVYDWQENVVEVEGQVTPLALPDSQHLQAKAGIEGQLTPRVLVTLAMGYGFANYGEVTGAASAAEAGVTAVGDITAGVGGLDGLLANAQIRYLASEDSEIFLGYQRNFMDTFFTNYLVYNYVYAGSSLELGHFKPGARYGVRLEEYEGFVSRRDALHRVNADLGYEIKEWADLTASAVYQVRTSTDPTVAYQDFNVNLIARFTY